MLRTIRCQDAYPLWARLRTVLIPKRFWAAIEAGEVTVAYRRWRRPTVRAGGTLRSPVGMLQIDEVAEIDDSELTPAVAHEAGYTDLADLLASLGDRPDARLHRIRFHRGGEDPRTALAGRTDLEPDEAAAVAAKLRRMDDRSHVGPWTQDTLEAIAASPGVRARELAAGLGRERDDFKKDVRRLKALGLTESLTVGYRLSPRGEAVLAGLRRPDR